MKVLVTGATGLLGTECVHVFSAGHEVTGLARHAPAGPLPGRERFASCDIRDARKTDREVARIRPDIIVHAAAMADVDACERDPDSAHATNAQGTENVARAAEKYGCRLILISTDYVFDGRARRPYREEDPTGPINAYGRTKLEGEEAVRRLTRSHLVIRTCWLFGANGNRFIRKVLEDAKSGGTLSFVADKVASPTHVRDLACAIMLLFQEKNSWTGETLHITNSGSASWHEYARVVLELSGQGKGVRLRRITQADLGRDAVRPKMTALDTARYQHRTGHALRPWQEAIKECV